MKRTSAAILAAIVFCFTSLRAQTPAVPSPEEVGKALGFTSEEITKIKAGEIIRKDLKEGSDKELAGVVGAFFKQPVSELVNVVMQGKLLETSAGMLALHGWSPDEPADQAFAGVALSPSETAEAAIFAKAAPGSKLNLSTADIALFQNLQPTPDSVNPQLRAMLMGRYEAYRKSGLKGIAPYTRGGRNESSPGRELELAIKETMTAARRPDYFNALLSYPADQLPDMQHRFYWFKQTVEGRPTFILADRAERHFANAALLTEEQFYVGHSYNSNFIAGGCLEVQGGTLVFYVNRTFTDQVAGWGSGMKHSIGRGQMLDEVAASLKNAQQRLQN
jgi:hypothetical protein